MRRRTMVGLGCLVVGLLLAGSPAFSQSRARKSPRGVPKLQETLAWLKQLDTNPASATKQPRFAQLTLNDLKSMDQIQLGGHRATDGKHVFINPGDFRYLRALPALKKVNLVEVDGLTVEALSHLGKIPSLTYLNLGDGAVTDAAVVHLTKLKNLTFLGLAWTKVGDGAMPIVARIPSVEILRLGGTKVSDEGIAQLRRLRNLKELHVQNCPVTDRGLLQLRGNKALKIVNLGKKTKVTGRAIAQLKKFLPNCTVEKK